VIASKPLAGSAQRLIMDYLISLAVAVALGVYLFYALLRPEKF
jgi:K+-transporting ATPase KdpF subunit